MVVYSLSVLLHSSWNSIDVGTFHESPSNSRAASCPLSAVKSALPVWEVNGIIAPEVFSYVD
jgi:hypothetical protein